MRFEICRQVHIEYYLTCTHININTQSKEYSTFKIKNIDDTQHFETPMKP